MLAVRVKVVQIWEVALVVSKLKEQFFSELKQYNGTNFRALREADLSTPTPSALKAFNSTITRYFIFSEKHPEISADEMRILYYQLKLDMVARYFANYPAASIDELKPFQLELQNFISETKAG